MPHSRPQEDENRTTVLCYIITGSDGSIDPEYAGAPPTFSELVEMTKRFFVRATLNRHLNALIAEGLITKDYDPKSKRLGYVIANEKQSLLAMLNYFIEREKAAMKNTVELERAVGSLKIALKPFGKLPKDIQKAMRELEKEGWNV